MIYMLKHDTYHEIMSDANNQIYYVNYKDVIYDVGLDKRGNPRGI